MTAEEFYKIIKPYMEDCYTGEQPKGDIPENERYLCINYMQIPWSSIRDISFVVDKEERGTDSIDIITYNEAIRWLKGKELLLFVKPYLRDKNHEKVKDLPLKETYIWFTNGYGRTQPFANITSEQEKQIMEMYGTIDNSEG